MKSHRQIIAVIFLALFCMIQLADLHVFGHDDDEGHCTLCIVTIDGPDNDFYPTDIIQIPETVIVPAKVVRSTYINNYFVSSFDYSSQNKAPPLA